MTSMKKYKERLQLNSKKTNQLGKGRGQKIWRDTSLKIYKGGLITCSCSTSLLSRKPKTSPQRRATTLDPLRLETMTTSSGNSNEELMELHFPLAEKETSTGTSDETGKLLSKVQHTLSNKEAIPVLTITQETMRNTTCFISVHSSFIIVAKTGRNLPAGE